MYIPVLLMLSLDLYPDMTLYSASQKKGNPEIKLILLKNCNDLSEKVYIVTKFSLSSLF